MAEAPRLDAPCYEADWLVKQIGLAAEGAARRTVGARAAIGRTQGEIDNLRARLLEAAWCRDEDF